MMTISFVFREDLDILVWVLILEKDYHIWMGLEKD